MNPVHVIGGGLAGSEAAWQLARAGVPVVLHEMRPVRGTEAHVGAGLAELVCSNSFRSDDPHRNAVGLLHEEMRQCGSLILRAADAHKLPAGGALAVDRVGFSEAVENALAAETLVEIRREEIAGLPPSDWDEVIIATGPLTSPALAEAIARLTGEESLAFFDAIAPIVYRDTINFDKAWLQSRYDKGDGADYVNCALAREEYAAFVAALIAGEKTEFHDWEKSTPYFEGCLPVEVMAARGPDTLRFGPMKPVGLRSAPQHLHQFPAPPRPRSAAESDAAAALRRADHRGRRLCRERRDRSFGRPLRRRGAARGRDATAAGDDRAGRFAAAHHRRRRFRHLPADECQFRAVPAAVGQTGGARSRPARRQEAADGATRARGFGCLAEGYRACSLKEPIL